MSVDFEIKDNYDINDFLRLVTVLRSPGGCPWDRKQTHESIKKNFIEETYEVVEAIKKNSAMFCFRLPCIPKWKAKKAALILMML